MICPKCGHVFGSKVKPGSIAERIVMTLRKMPEANYGDVALRCKSNRKYVSFVAHFHGLRRNTQAIDEKVRKRMIEMIRNTDLSYEQIGNRCGGRSKQSIRDFAVRMGLHDPRRRKRGRPRKKD